MLNKELLLACSTGGGDLRDLVAYYTTEALTEGEDLVKFAARWWGGIPPYELRIDGVLKYTGNETHYEDSWRETEAPNIPETVVVTDATDRDLYYVIEGPEEADTE